MSDHVHSEEEMQLARHVQSLHQHLELLSVSERILRSAVLKLLPNEGDAVEVDLAVPMIDEQGNSLTRIRLLRTGADLDVQPA